MDFGANWAKYDQLNLELPADHPITGKVLKNGSGEGRIRFGSSGWTRKEYNGTLYPKGTSANHQLTEYSRLFDCVELNATHYKIYSTEEIGKWMEKVKNREFMFCPKFPQAISHHSSLLNAAEETNAFIDGIRAFGNQLGPAFLQLSESFSPARKLNLYTYLASLPEDIDFFVEVRHPDWFRQPYELNELMNTLREHSMGAVITDTPGRRDCLHMALTVPKLFLRFVTQGGHPLDMQRLLNWKDKLDEWTEQGLEEIYFFLHVHEGQHEAAFYREVQHVFGTAKGEVQLSLF